MNVKSELKQTKIRLNTHKNTLSLIIFYFLIKIKEIETG